ncbi:MAK10-like protein [Tanacetum coccineum]
MRSDTIRLVQNGFSFHGLWSEDPNQHLKDFLKLVDSLDLDVANTERALLCLFQFSLREQASNWLERLLAGSISTWEDLTTHFLAQFFPPGRTSKLRNDILMFQQHQSESLSEAWTRFKDLLQKVPHNGIDLWLKDLALYDNESWNNPRDFAKPVKAISLPQDVLSTSVRRLIELKNQVQRLMEYHLAPKSSVQVNNNAWKIPTTLNIAWKILNTILLIMNPHVITKWELSNKTREGTKCFDSHQEKRLSSLGTQLKQQQDDVINKINTLWMVVSEKFDNTPAHDNAGDSMARVNATEEKVGEGESRDIKRDDLDDRACGDTKGVEEVE